MRISCDCTINKHTNMFVRGSVVVCDKCSMDHNMISFEMHCKNTGLMNGLI